MVDNTSDVSEQSKAIPSKKETPAERKKKHEDLIHGIRKHWGTKILQVRKMKDSIIYNDRG